MKNCPNQTITQVLLFTKGLKKTFWDFFWLFILRHNINRRKNLMNIFEKIKIQLLKVLFLEMYLRLYCKSMFIRSKLLLEPLFLHLFVHAQMCLHTEVNLP